MSSTYTPVTSGTWNSTYTLPDDADNRGASATNTPIEALADNVAKLYQLSGDGWYQMALSPGYIFSFTPESNGYGLLQNSVTTPVVNIPVPTFESGEITYVEAVVSGGSTHSSLPANMPGFTLMRRTLSGTWSTTAMAIGADGSADVSAYETLHTITTSVTGATLSSDYSFYVAFAGEYGANSIANELILHAVRVKLENT